MLATHKSGFWLEQLAFSIGFKDVKSDSNCETWFGATSVTFPWLLGRGPLSGLRCNHPKPQPRRAFSWGFANLQRNRSLQLAWPVEIMTPVRLERYSTKFAEMSYIFTCRVSRLSIWIAYFRDISAIFTHVEDAKEEQEQPQYNEKRLEDIHEESLTSGFAYHGIVEDLHIMEVWRRSSKVSDVVKVHNLLGEPSDEDGGHRCRVLTMNDPKTPLPGMKSARKDSVGWRWVMFVGSMIGERRQHSNCQPSGSAVLAFCHNLHVGE